MNNSELSMSVDDEDYEHLSKFRWRSVRDHNTFYAYRSYKDNQGKKYSISTHRMILGLSPGDKLYGEHKDRNGLNNTRENLRIATNSQNQANMRLKKNNTSGYKGVSFRKEERKWEAYIKVNRKRIHLGNFESAEEANQAYKDAAKTYFGEFAG